NRWPHRGSMESEHPRERGKSTSCAVALASACKWKLTFGPRIPSIRSRRVPNGGAEVDRGGIAKW
ncbi:MAG: hypothetical protein AAEJ47_09715, partial [Planctomycetota bacterium]